MLLLILAVAVVAAAVGVALVARATPAGRAGDVAGPSGPPTTSPGATVVATTTGEVRVHSGGKVGLGYRVAGVPAAGATLVVEVRDEAGAAVLTKSLPVGAADGAGTATLRVALPAGSYTYSLRLTGPDGSGQTSAASSALRVLAPLTPGFPGGKATRSALSWARSRDGRVAVAVVDTNGRLWGLNEHETFQAASLAKAMLLVAYLRAHPSSDAALDPVVTKMIEESDNASAYRVFDVVGATGMRAVARLARMEDYVQGSSWLDTRVSAADQARFFYHLQEYVPPARRTFARKVLAGVVPIQRWGIPAAAGPAGWKTYFKGGWLGEDNHLMLQAAWLDKGKRHWALAVMSDKDPTRSYGWDTEKGVTGLLLGKQPTAAFLALVLE
jgi:hypothetical protein